MREGKISFHNSLKPVEKNKRLIACFVLQGVTADCHRRIAETTFFYTPYIYIFFVHLHNHILSARGPPLLVIMWSCRGISVMMCLVNYAWHLNAKE